MLARIRKAQEENEGGFTLIELLVVIIIIGILAAIAIPVFLNQRNKGYDSQAKSDLRNAATIQETHLTDTGVYATLAQLQAVGYDFQQSSDVTGFTVESGAGTTTGYCMEAVSASGSTFTLDSTVSSGVTTGANC
jgi:type IV pilus assembly protein PilA